MEIVRSFVAASVVLFVATAAGAEARFLTGAELGKIIPGHTWQTKQSKTGKVLVLAYKGKVSGESTGTYDGKPNNGKWRIDGDSWCEDWGRGKACWQVVQKDAGTLLLFENGKQLKYPLALVK